VNAARSREPSTLPLLLIVVAIPAIAVTTQIATRGEGAWVDWFSAFPVAIQIEGGCGHATGYFPAAEVHRIPNSRSWLTALSWAAILAAALVGVRSWRAAHVLANVAIALATLALAIHGTFWLEQAVVGTTFHDVLPCDSSRADFAVAADRANWFRDLWPLTVSYLMLVCLKIGDTSEFAELRPVTAHRWRAGVAGGLACVPLAATLVSDFGMTSSQMVTVKWFMGYPLLFLSCIAVAALWPYGRLRTAGLAAIGTGISLTFTLYGSLLLYQQPHNDKLVVNGSPWRVTRASTLREETRAAFENAEWYYLAMMTAFLALWLGSLVTRRLAVSRRGE
jgi:hypothetical protein